MPNMNQAGPQGAGPMTGRGMGMCNNADVSTPFYGNRMGRGRRSSCGRGRGYGAIGFYEAPKLTADEQKDILDNQKSFLESRLASIDEQIKKL